ERSRGSPAVRSKPRARHASDLLATFLRLNIARMRRIEEVIHEVAPVYLQALGIGRSIPDPRSIKVALATVRTLSVSHRLVDYLIKFGGRHRCATISAAGLAIARLARPDTTIHMA
ncbi:MAG: hypothetical protein J2P17_05240, partial [Mycobacterium sp.]|nr:hypothetical protein [Mycobacterium sp.]